MPVGAVLYVRSYRLQKRQQGTVRTGVQAAFSAVGKPAEEYALSLKDMSLVRHVDELCDIGCASFKIEGRMKRPEYVAAAVTALRNAVDGTGDTDADMKRLEAVFPAAALLTDIL